MHHLCKRLFGCLCLIALSINMVTPVYAAEAIANTPAIEIYTASYCSDCKRAKAYMNAHNIVFNEHDVEFNLINRQAFRELGGKGVPLLVVNGQKMHGFNAAKLEKLISKHAEE